MQCPYNDFVCGGLFQCFLRRAGLMDFDFGFGADLADFAAASFLRTRGREDFVGDFVAGAFEGAPHVPTGDGAIGAPAFAEGEEFFGLGHAFFAVGDGPAFFYAEVVDGEDVGAAEIEDEKHFDGPGADAADGDEAFDEFVVGEFFGLFAGGDDAGDCFGGEIFHGEEPWHWRGRLCGGIVGFELNIFSGVGGRPLSPRALTRPKMVAAALPEMDW